MPLGRGGPSILRGSFNVRALGTELCLRRHDAKLDFDQESISNRGLAMKSTAYPLKTEDANGLPIRDRGRTVRISPHFEMLSTLPLVTRIFLLGLNSSRSWVWGATEQKTGLTSIPSHTLLHDNMLHDVACHDDKCSIVGD